MKRVAHSPWFGISLALVGLIIGYSLVIVQRGEAASPLECIYEIGKDIQQAL